MRSILILTFISSFSYVQCSSIIQPHHANLTQIADVACWKSGSNYTLTFFLTKNADNIDLVYTESYFDPTRVSVGNFDSNGNGIEGNGTDETPFTFTITGTGDLPMTDITLSSHESLVKMAYVKSPDVIGITVISKSRYQAPFGHQVLFAEDVRFDIYCNFSQIEDNFVTSGQFAVNGSIGEAGYLLNDSAVLEVLSQGSPISTATVGDPISLSATINTPSRSTGVYVHSCFICDQVDCNGSQKLNFIDSNGCTTNDYFSVFVRNSGISTRTSDFPAFTFSTQNYLFFGCTVSFCYDAADTRCDNYCAYNSAQGRKRRQAPDTQEQVDRKIEAFLKITFDGQNSPLFSGGPDTLPTLTKSLGLEGSRQDTVLLAVVITLACLLLIGIVAFVWLFCRTVKQKSII